MIAQRKALANTNNMQLNAENIQNTNYLKNIEMQEFRAKQNTPLPPVIFA